MIVKVTLIVLNWWEQSSQKMANNYGRSLFIMLAFNYCAILTMGSFTVMTGLVLARALTRENYCTTYEGNPGTCKLRVENCATLKGVPKKSVKSCVKSGISLPWNPICCPKSDRKCEPPSAPKRGNSLRCGKSPRIKAIVGGQVTEKNKYPWMVAILAKSGSSFKLVCGGSLISERFVLTAAHCVTKTSGKQNPADLKILVGAHDITRDGTVYAVKGVYPHEDYKFWLAYHDIALIKLARDVPFDDIINPVCLAPASLLKKIQRQQLIGYPAIVAGWGTTSYEGSTSTKLREVTVEVYNRTVCNQNYDRMDGARSVLPQGITESFVCAGAEGRDSCQGDSGGPLIYYHRSSERYYQLGVVSFGYKCAEPGFPGVYSNIPYYLKWIGCHMDEYHDKD